MSAKQEATYHGADVVTRLRLYGPESDYNGIMGEAADEIERLRAKPSDTERVDKVHELIAAIEEIVVDKTNCAVLRSGWDGSLTLVGSNVAHRLDAALGGVDE